jgi:hypothetical protein
MRRARGARTLANLTEPHIRALNESIAKQSTTFAGRSHELIEFLARKFKK